MRGGRDEEGRKGLTRVAHGAGVVLALMWVPSCLSLPVPGQGSERSGQTLSWQVVAEKREPNLLIAGNRSYCEVAYDRFEDLEEGQRVFCHWRER